MMNLLVAIVPQMNTWATITSPKKMKKRQRQKTTGMAVTKWGLCLNTKQVTICAFLSIGPATIKVQHMPAGVHNTITLTCAQASA